MFIHRCPWVKWVNIIKVIYYKLKSLTQLSCYVHQFFFKNCKNEKWKIKLNNLRSYIQNWNTFFLECIDIVIVKRKQSKSKLQYHIIFQNLLSKRLNCKSYLNTEKIV